jgi:hypothetical protein
VSLTRTLRTTAKVIATVVLLGSSSVSRAAAGFVVTLNPGPEVSRLEASAREASQDDPIVDALEPTTLPVSASTLAIDGGNSSDSHFELSNDSFSMTFDQSRTATQYAYGSTDWDLYFTVDARVRYRIEGVMTAVDAEGRQIFQDASLVDLTTGKILFLGRQKSLDTPNESFTLGLAEGDEYGYVSGSLEGNLRAGHHFVLHGRNHISANPVTPSGATASGFQRLTLRPVGSLPALSPAACLALAGVLLAACQLIARPKLGVGSARHTAGDC